MERLIESYRDDAIALRHELHRIPELQYQEIKTSALITQTLRSYGYEIQSGLAKTGIVALLDTAKPGKTIAFRADFDALPIAEETDLSYKSRHSGNMHACGHDGHTATLLLVARVLQEIKSELTGKIKLIFQPAEEGGKGSSAMIEAGVLDDPKVDAIFGYHNWPGLPLNTVATRSGCLLTGSGRFEIELRGKRAHLSRPQDGVNPVTIGASMIQQINTLTLPSTVVNVIAFNSGDWQAGQSERAEIVACYFCEGDRELDKLKREVFTIVGKAGSATFHPFQPATVNTPQETQHLLSTARRLAIGEVRELNACKMVADDFSEYLRHIPGCYFLVGAGESKASLHTAHYDFPDEILAPTAALFIELISKAQL